MEERSKSREESLSVYRVNELRDLCRMPSRELRRFADVFGEFSEILDVPRVFDLHDSVFLIDQLSPFDGYFLDLQPINVQKEMAV